MAELTTQLQTNNQLIVDKDFSKFLLGFNEFGSGDVTASGADVVITEGMALSRIGATGKIKPLNLSVVDGTEYIVGLSTKDITVADGTTATINFVNKGRVESSKIDVPSGTLNSLQGVTGSQKMVKDWLSDIGLVLLTGTELTKVDNS